MLHQGVLVPPTAVVRPLTKVTSTHMVLHLTIVVLVMLGYTSGLCRTQAIATIAATMMAIVTLSLIHI